MEPERLNSDDTWKNGQQAFYMTRSDGTGFNSRHHWYPAGQTSRGSDNLVSEIHIGGSKGNGAGQGIARYQVQTPRTPAMDNIYMPWRKEDTKEESRNNAAKNKLFDYNFSHHFSNKPFREQISWLRPYPYPYTSAPYDTVQIMETDEDKESCKIEMNFNNKEEMKELKKKCASAGINCKKCPIDCTGCKPKCHKCLRGCCKIFCTAIVVSIIFILLSTAINWVLILKSEQYVSSFDVVMKYNNDSYDVRLADTGFLSYRLYEIKFCFMMKAIFGDEMKTCRISYFSSGSLVIHARISLTQRYLLVEMINIGLISSNDVIERMIMNKIERVANNRTDVSLVELNLIDPTQPILAVVTLRADIDTTRPVLSAVCTDERSETCQAMFCRELRLVFSKWFDELFGSCAVVGSNRTSSGTFTLELRMELLHDKLALEALSNGKAATDEAMLNVLNGAIFQSTTGFLFNTNTKAVALANEQHSRTMPPTPSATTSAIINTTTTVGANIEVISTVPTESTTASTTVSDSTSVSTSTSLAPSTANVETTAEKPTTATTTTTRPIESTIVQSSTTRNGQGSPTDSNIDPEFLIGPDDGNFVIDVNKEDNRNSKTDNSKPSNEGKSNSNVKGDKVNEEKPGVVFIDADSLIKTDDNENSKSSKKNEEKPKNKLYSSDSKNNDEKAGYVVSDFGKDDYDKKGDGDVNGFAVDSDDQNSDDTVLINTDDFKDDSYNAESISRDNKPDILFEDLSNADENKSEHIPGFLDKDDGYEEEHERESLPLTLEEQKTDDKKEESGSWWSSPFSWGNSNSDDNQSEPTDKNDKNMTKFEEPHGRDGFDPESEPQPSLFHEEEDNVNFQDDFEDDWTNADGEEIDHDEHGYNDDEFLDDNEYED